MIEQIYAREHWASRPYMGEAERITGMRRLADEEGGGGLKSSHRTKL